MKYYTCDRCGREIESMITLKGCANPHGDILIPEPYQEKHFCSKLCLVIFVKPMVERYGKAVQAAKEQA